MAIPSTSASKSILTTPLATQPLLASMRATEALSQPFLLELSVVTKADTIAPSEILGKTLSVGMKSQGGTRYFHGHVTRLTSDRSRSTEQRRNVYTIELRPWLWLLTLTSRCRVFQDKTAVEIVKEVCGEHGFGNAIEESLTGSVAALPYCAQYNESDFAFVSRLLEQEGIYYYFAHSEREHKLVLVDDPEAHVIEGRHQRLSMKPKEGVGAEFIASWDETVRLRSQSYSLDDYDYLMPTKEIAVNLDTQAPHTYAHGEQYAYPGRYTETDVGQDYVRYRMEADNAPTEFVGGVATLLSFSPGATFTTEADPSKEYLLTATTTVFQIAAYQGSEPLAEEQPMDTTGINPRCVFTAIEKDKPFRPERRTPKPRISGLQTAMVVGADTGAPAGSVHTDEHGRVMVRFPWYDKSKASQQRSCWLRVAQVWAGNTWGAIFIPRVGHEVVVTFLEGDPDRPLIIGSVYNGLATPPYALPSKDETSGFKTATVEGDPSIELTLDDKASKIDMKGKAIAMKAVAPGLGGSVSIVGGQLGMAKLDVGGATEAISLTATTISLQAGMSFIELSAVSGITIGSPQPVQILSDLPLTLGGTPITLNGVPAVAPPKNPIPVMGVKAALDAAKAAVL